MNANVKALSHRSGSMVADTALLSERGLIAPFVVEGRVDYESLESAVDCHRLAREIGEWDLSGSSRDEKLAFYINAYNLLTIHQVLQELRRNREWPGVTTLRDKARFFVFRRHRVAGSYVSLMTLENRVIRRGFEDPRVHFALNCASRSCPPLASQLFVADTLDEDLDRLTAAFLEATVTCDRDARGEDVLQLSPLFKWYRRDFLPSVNEFIGRYRTIPEHSRVAYSAYDWRLNRL